MSDLYPIQEIAPNSFIFAVDDAISLADCAVMVEKFEANLGQQYTGRIGENQQVAERVKKSTDLRISGRKDWAQHDALFRESMGKAIKSLSALHPFFSVNRFKDLGYNLQRTREGEYYHWHLDAGPGELSQRVLVALWYLNDVVGPGGATEFYHQNLSIQPKAGRLVLFPPFWTHLHRNSILEKGVKYISTTWLCYA
jgi:Rps23 Pro-64 3,4-dihydroxylase Tpa1-like proline 4-hydroxylase